MVGQIIEHDFLRKFFNNNLSLIITDFLNFSTYIQIGKQLNSILQPPDAETYLSS